MYPLNQLKSLVSCGRDPARSLPFRRGFLLIPLILAAFALAPVQAAVDTPDPGSVSNTNTADGVSALSGVTGFYNSAFGFLALLSNGASSFNTGVGAGTLLLNTAIENTAVGTGALLSNNGPHNTAVGAFALFTNSGDPNPDNGLGAFNNAVGANSLLFNTTGSSNNAVGESALFLNDTGAANTAIGDVALSSGAGDENSLNTAVGEGALFGQDGMVSNSNNAVGAEALVNILDGGFNNAVGVFAMGDNASGSGNVAVGDSAGAGVEGSFNIYIGFAAGPGGGSEDETIRIGDSFNTACFIGGITGVPVSGDAVCVDGNGQLGACAPASPGKTALQQLKATTETQAAKIASQEGQIQSLTAALKQQAEQIQKVSAQLEMIRPTPRVVGNR